MVKHLNIEGERVCFDEPERLIWYGNCGFWTDDWDKVSKNEIPCCPHCGVVGFQMTWTKWKKEIKEFNKNNPQYLEFMLFHQEQCLPGNTTIEKYKKWVLTKFNTLKEYIEREGMR